MSQSFDSGHGFKQAGSDSEIERQIAEHCEKHGIGPLDSVKLFAVLARHAERHLEKLAMG